MRLLRAQTRTQLTRRRKSSRRTFSSSERLPRRRTPESLFSVSLLASPVDTPLPLPTNKFDPEIKKENELLRSFRVKISNIEIVNETKEVIDPFIRFIIGGSFFTEIKKRGSDKIYLP